MQKLVVPTRSDYIVFLPACSSARRGCAAVYVLASMQPRVHNMLEKEWCKRRDTNLPHGHCTDSTPGPCTPDFGEFNRAPPQMTQTCSHHYAQLLLGEGQYHIPDMQ